jgi:L-threonylcarbamoyladenylate synthase
LGAARVLTRDEVAAFESCIREGGIAVFPADTVYGLACDPDSAASIERMYALKRRPPSTPSAVMFFGLQPALRALEGLGELTRRALLRLLPGPVTVVVPNPAGAFPLAAGGETLGIRVPTLDGPLAALGAVETAVLQTSANLTGGPDPCRLSEVPIEIREGADLELDAGARTGRPSTVVDLAGYEREGRWEIIREGALDGAVISDLLSRV